MLCKSDKPSIIIIIIKIMRMLWRLCPAHSPNPGPIRIPLSKMHSNVLIPLVYSYSTSNILVVQIHFICRSH